MRRRWCDAFVWRWMILSFVLQVGVYYGREGVAAEEPGVNAGVSANEIQDLLRSNIPKQKGLKRDRKIRLQDIQPPTEEEILSLKNRPEPPLPEREEKPTGKKDDVSWWSHLYANAPVPVRKQLGPKDRYVPLHEPTALRESKKKPTFQVMLPMGVTTDVEGSVDDTPAELLKSIQQSKGVDASGFGLFIKDQESPLVANHPLKDQGVSYNMLLMMKKPAIAQVVLPDGTRLPLYGSPSSLVLQLKKMLASTTKVPIYQMVLGYSNRELDDNKTLIEQGVPTGATLHLGYASTISVKAANGALLHFDISPFEPLSQLQPLLRAQLGVAPASQSLLYKGRVLSFQESMDIQGIPPRSTLDLVVLPGAIVLYNQKEYPLLGVQESDSLMTLKERLKSVAGILDIDHIGCTFNGDVLKDHTPLQSQGFRHGGPIECFQKPSILLQFNGKEFALYVGFDTTFAAFQQTVSEATGILPDFQELYYEGKPVHLGKDKPFSTLKVAYGARITLKKKPSVLLWLTDGTVKPIEADRAVSLGTALGDILNQIPVEKGQQLALYVAGRELDLNKSLQEEDIAPGATLYVVATPVNPVETGDGVRKGQPIRVVLEDKKMYVLEATSNADDVETVIAALNKASQKKVAGLFYHSKMLQADGEPLFKKGVPNGAVLRGETFEHQTRMKRSAAGSVADLKPIPDCDIVLNGEDCFEDVEAKRFYWKFEKRVLWVMLSYASVIFALGFIVRSAFKVLARRVAKSRDRFLRDFYETAFVSFTVVAITISVVDVVINLDIFDVELEAVIFGKFDQLVQMFEHGEKIMSRKFTVISQIVQFYLATYLVLVLYLALVLWRVAVWLQAADRVPVQTLAEKPPSRAVAAYVALRYEFSDKVEPMTVGGLDPENYNFLEYLQACLLKLITRLIRLPASLLLASAILIFCTMPIAHFRRYKMLIAIFSFLGAVMIILGFILFRVLLIKRFIIPRQLNEYLRLRHQYSLHDAPFAGDEALQECGPRYNLLPVKRKSIFPNWCVRILYGTRFPNKHESLFWFWRHGPEILYRLFEAAVFLGLCVTAHAFYLIGTQWATWARTYGPWPLVGFLALLILLPVLITINALLIVVVTSTGGIIQEGVLSEVWELQRSETVRRIAQFIDALRIEATLHEIARSGEDFMEQLIQTAHNVPEEVVEENNRIWGELDDDEDGQINFTQVYSFLTHQGLNIGSEAEAQKWVEVFDIDNSGGIDKREFFVIVTIAKQLTTETLDVDALTRVLQEKFNFDPENTAAVSVSSLYKLTRVLHISSSWNDNRFVHLVEFISGERGVREISLAQFVEGLKRIEVETIGTLAQAVDELKAKKVFAPALEMA